MGQRDDIWRLQTKEMSVTISSEQPHMEIYTAKGEFIVSTPSLTMVTPLFFDREPLAIHLIKTIRNDKKFTAVFSIEHGAATTYQICFELIGDMLAMQTYYTAEQDHALYGWELFPAGSRFNLYELINFRHRAGLRDVYEKLPLSAGHGTKWEKTGTYSDDWNFAPHPSFLLFRKNTIHLSFGALDLPPGFGLQCAIKNQRVSRFLHDYGDGVYRVRAKEKVQSPRYLLKIKQFVGSGRELKDKWLWEMADEYVKTIQKMGLIPDPREHKKYIWHQQPHYCTFGDQVFLARQANKQPLTKTLSVISQQQQQDFALAHNVVSPGTILNEELVRKAVDVIRREKLTVKIFIIDDGWQRGLGNWMVNETKFPDFRGLIDWLHSEGFKVALWWAPVHLDMNRQHWPEARYLADNGHTLMTHGIPLIDFSNPLTRKEYLDPLLRRFVSSEPGCYNADMIKLDFTADKVQRHIPVYDRQWCGEEKYFYEMFRHISSVCRGYKQDFCFFTYCPHPYLAQWQELVLTSELWTSDTWAHWEKMQYIKTFCPGVGVNFFSHMFRENLGEFYDLARAEGCSVSQYGVLGHIDEVSGAMTKEDYQLLRKKLRAAVK